MYVQKVSSQISLRSPHRLITETLSAFMIFFYQEIIFVAKIKIRRKVCSLINLCGLRELIWDNTKHCVEPSLRGVWPIY